MRSRTKKLISMLCVAAMLVSALPVAAFAVDGEAHDEAVHANVYEVAADAQLKGVGTMKAPALLAAPRAANPDYIYNISEKGTAGNTVYTLKGSLKQELTVTYNNLTFSRGLKMESGDKTLITVKVTEPGSLLLVSDTAKRISVDDTVYTMSGSPAATVSVSLTEGSHRIIKSDSMNLLYMEFTSSCSNHRGENWTVTKAATCVEAGSREGTCPDCDRKVTETIAPTGVHTWSATEFTVIKAPSCGVAGSKAAKCVNCTATNTAAPVAVPALEHEYVGTFTICKNCGVDKTTNEKHTAHTGEWHETTAATCLKEGEETRTCTACGAVETQATEKLEHSFTGAGGVCVNGCGMKESELKGDMTKQGGDFESAYIEWTIGVGETRYEVFVKATSANTWTKLDSELVREYSGYMRADALGLKAGTYQMKVVPYKGDAAQAELLSTSLEVKAHERTGFAFVNGTASGAYNEDGTLKSNARVIYITEKTKDTVTLGVDMGGKGVETECVGLMPILLGYKKQKDNRPLAIRIVGEVARPKELNNGCCYVDSCINGITIEGVGKDATLNGWGFLIKGSSNIEMRNLGILNSSGGDGDNLSIEQKNNHIWIHNMDMFYASPGGDTDQAKGDGALDIKETTYVTVSYNHFWDCGKTSLLGMHNLQDYITYHHNWFDHSDSRHPRIRVAKSVHIYNNYYDGVAKYGVGAAENSGAFVEANYFRNTKYPMLTSMQGSDIAGGNTGTFSKEDGGVIKAWNNIMIGAKDFIPYDATNAPVEFDAYVAKTRDEKVPSYVSAKQGGTTYNNFDTTADIGVKASQIEAPAQAMITTTGWAGRVEGGDFQWEFDNTTEDENYNVIPELKTALLAYKTSMLSVGGGVSQTVSGDPVAHTHVPGAWKVTKAAGCDSKTQTLVDGVETQYCTICGEVVNTRKLTGAHSNDGQGKCAICGATVANGGGPAVSGNSKTLKGSDFKGASTSVSITQADLDAKYNGYFKLVGNNVKPGSSSTTNAVVDHLALPSGGGSGISFTVTNGSAEVTAKVSSTGKDKSSKFVLKDENGAAVVTKEGATVITVSKNVSDATSVKYSLTNGTYTLYTADGSANGVRLVELVVTEAEKAHNWGEWVIIREATCGQDGLMRRTCLDEDCGKTETHEIDATGKHQWDDGVVDENGDTVYTCTVCKATETEPGEEPTTPVAVTAVVLNRSAATLNVNGTVTLTATVSPSNATDKTVTWTSSDAGVATVQGGVVTAKAVGAATITATCGGKSATCAVTVKSSEPTATTKDYTFAAADQGTQSADNNPVADGTKLGTDNYFTVVGSRAVWRTKNKDKDKATSSLQLAQKTENADTHAVSPADKFQFTVPEGSTAKTVTIGFSSTGSDNHSALALVNAAGERQANSAGKTVTVFKGAGSGTTVTFGPLSAGTYTIMVPENVTEAEAGTTFDSSNTSDPNDPNKRGVRIFNVTVKQETTSGGVDTTVYVDTVTVTPATKALSVGDTATLTATVTPADATNKDVTWTSSNTAVATVANGVVTAKAAGEAIITATADGVNGLCTVTVTGSGNTPTPPGPSGDGGGSSGGGGGGGGSAPTKKPTVEVTPGDDTFITINSATKDNVAVAELTDSQAKALTNNAVKENSANIVVTVNALDSAGTTRLNVSANALDNMADKTDAALTIQTPTGDVKLPAATVADLGGNSGKTISVLIAKTDDGVKLTVAAGNKILDKVAGGVTAITEAEGSGSVAYLVAADGSEKLVKKSYVEAGKLHANVPGSGTIVLKDNAKTFRDTEDSWAKDAIGFAASRELFNGVNALDFAPNQEMTRAMLVTVLYRLEGAVNKAGNSFKDVPADSWYADAVAWANAEGIVSGKLEGYFGPDDNITREQLATILYRYATKLCGMGEVSESSTALEKYPDTAVVSGFAVDGMKWCVREGVIGGRGDGTLAPSGFASRAEVATMLMRFVKAIV